MTVQRVATRRTEILTNVRHILYITDSTTTPHHNRFTTLFPGPPGWAGARRELLDFMVQGKINRGRHTDHPADGLTSALLHQTPIFYKPDALPAAQPTVSKHRRQLYHWQYRQLKCIKNDNYYSVQMACVMYYINCDITRNHQRCLSYYFKICLNNYDFTNVSSYLLFPQKFPINFCLAQKSGTFLIFSAAPGIV